MIITIFEDGLQVAVIQGYIRLLGFAIRTLYLRICNPNVKIPKAKKY